MSNSTSIEPDLTIATNMASLTTHNPSPIVTDDDHPTTLSTTDLQPYAQDGKHVKTDIDATGTQPDNTAKAAGCSNKTSSSASSTSLSANTRPDTPGTSILGAAPTYTAMQSTQPVPTIYPPRRANIFKTRQKNIRFPLSGLGPVTPTIQQLEAADGFSMANLEEFQAQIKDRIKKKSEMFMNMVRQSAWQSRRVEDLGEVFQIED